MLYATPVSNDRRMMEMDKNAFTVVDRTVYEAGGETAGKEEDIGVFDVDFFLKERGYLRSLTF